ncbi:zinc finger protein AEBP2 [Sebastes fasciatus]|uniref:zinc finger protein AEBP2 n=1 Tax=Sebastes fasciatus TaxID=394691 RepID=UPI003D9E3CDE
MAQISTEPEPDSQPTEDLHGAGPPVEPDQQQADPDQQDPAETRETSSMEETRSAGPGLPGPVQNREGGPGEDLVEPGQDGLPSSTESAPEDSSTRIRVLREEQRDPPNPDNVSSERTKTSTATEPIRDQETGTGTGEPLSRMDSEDSISSTLMDMESTASSGRSTPAMLNGHGAVAGSVSAAVGVKPLSYTCCWDHCQLLFLSSPDLAEHIRTSHVDGQRGGVFVCLWKGCKVYNTPSTSQSWLQRHMLTHSGDKPFKCVVGGCNATFASQGGLARHVPTHFSSQSSSKLSNQGRVKEESPSKAGLNKRRKLKNKHRRSLPRPHDFFDAQTMDAIRHRAICLNLATHIESLGNGHSVVFHSTVIARRKEDSGKVKVLLHWTPEDILPDVWVNESDRLQQKTQVVHLSKLPTDTAVLLDPNIYRMFF